MTARSDLSRRLAKLERGIEPEVECAGLDWLGRMKTIVLAFHLGDAQPEESMATAYGRALGYEASSEMKRDLLAANGEVSRRHGAAMGRLFAQHGIDIATTSWEQQVDTFDKLLAEMPHWMTDRVGILPGLTSTDALL